MIIYHQNHIAAFVGAHKYFNSLQIILSQRISVTTAAIPGQPFYIRDNYTMPPYLGIGVG